MKENSNHTYSESMETQRLEQLLEQVSVSEDVVDVAAIKRKTLDKVERYKRMRKARVVTLVMAVAAGLLLLFTLNIKHDFVKEQPLVQANCETKEKTVDMLTLDVPVGEQRTIILADGTKLTANSRSKVTYPAEFIGGNREIKVHGEVYLEVAHDADHPFVVNADGFNLKVLGTKFNISAYDRKRTNIVLLEGSIEVTTTKKQTVRMKPNQKMGIQDGSMTDISTVDVNDYVSWKDGLLQLRGEPLALILERLNDYYGSDYTCDAEHQNQRFYGKLVMQDDEQDVLRSLMDIIPFKAYTKKKH